MLFTDDDDDDGGSPDEVREVASVFWLNLIHVGCELFSTSLHLQQQKTLIAVEEPRPLREGRVSVCI